MPPLPRSFYLRSTPAVARALLGTRIIRRIGRTVLSGIIVETEAYLQNDPASHSFRGPTERNRVMFGPAGHLYVYFTYGMHFCANVVTGPAGRGEAVLIRAVEPLEGTDVMARRRGKAPDAKELTNGPAKFAQAFGIDRSHSGVDLTESSIWISKGIRIPRSRIVTTTRIGISTAKEELLRFYIRGNRWVSRTSVNDEA